MSTTSTHDVTIWWAAHASTAHNDKHSSSSGFASSNAAKTSRPVNTRHHVELVQWPTQSSRTAVLQNVKLLARVHTSTIVIICPIAIAQHETDHKITCVCVSVRAPTAAVFIQFWWNFAQWFQGRSDGGYIGIYTPKSVYLNVLCGCFVSLLWLVNIYTHPNQIPGYATEWFGARKVRCSLFRVKIQWPLLLFCSNFYPCNALQREGSNTIDRRGSPRTYSDG